jgi:hypothetical protein
MADIQDNGLSSQWGLDKFFGPSCYHIPKLIPFNAIARPQSVGEKTVPYVETCDLAVGLTYKCENFEFKVGVFGA